MQFFFLLPLKWPCVLYTQTGSQEQAGASWAARPPMALWDSQAGHLSPQGYCSLCLHEHFTLASMFLLGFKTPRGFGEGSPEFTIYLFWRHTELRHQSPSPQANLSISPQHCVPFVPSPDAGSPSSGFYFVSFCFWFSLPSYLSFLSLLL